jgi:hypothetical protein
MVERERQRLPHQAGGADSEVEPRQMRVAQNLADAVTFLADEPAQAFAKFHLGGGVGTIAGLVLELLQVEPVATAVGQEAGTNQAGHAAFGPSKREESVRLRHREEPLVPGDQIDPTLGCVLKEARGGLGLAQVGAALLFGHGVADAGADLLCHR